MMRILTITNLYPNPYQPHRATFKRNQQRTLATMAEIEVIAPISWVDELRARREGKGPLPDDRKLVSDGITVYHPRYYYMPMVGRRLHGYWYERSVSPIFHREVKSFRPDVVMVSWAYPDGWAVVRLGKSVGLPVILQVHGSDIKRLEKYPSIRPGTIEAVRGATGVVTVSRDLANCVIGFGADPKRVRLIYGGIDTSVFKPANKAQARSVLGLAPTSEPMLLFIGNLLPVKGLDVLLPAIAKVVSSGSPVQLYLIGSGPLRASLEQQAKELGIEDRVWFMGSFAQASLTQWYQSADLFVLPSRSEGVPNVLLEASACGLPWVASDVGGVSEILARGKGLLVPPENVDKLAEGILEWLEATRPKNPFAPDGHLRHISLIPPWTHEQSVEQLMGFLTQCVSASGGALQSDVVTI